MRKIILASILTAFLMSSPATYAGEYFFTPEMESFPNPGRGWYRYAPLLEDNSYARIGNLGYRLVYGAITLGEFVHQDIDAATLDIIRQRFDELRTNGVKAVLRVNYNEESTGTDASMDQMIRHMQQLQPLLAENKDVIAYIEAGYFGQWGEFHDWCGGNDNTDLTDDFCSKHLDNVQTWSTIINALLQYVPDDRFVLLRYPGKKQAVFGGEPVISSEAYTSLAKARVGHHNDCFLATYNDRFTYQTVGTSTTEADLKAYVGEDTQYLPIGGETCYAESGHRFSCDLAVPEMEQLHWTYLNGGYYQGASDIWHDGGCYTEIDRRLGYRFELLSATLPDELVKGETQAIQIRIRNSGFSRAHNYRKAYLRLFNGNDIFADLELENIDLRMIGAGETITLSGTFTIPDTIDQPSTSVALWLPDLDSRNWSNSRFSVRLAYVQNESDWDSMDSPGHNSIADDIPIVDAGSDDATDGSESDGTGNSEDSGSSGCFIECLAEK